MIYFFYLWHIIVLICIVGIGTQHNIWGVQELKIMIIVYYADVKKSINKKKLPLLFPAQSLKRFFQRVFLIFHHQVLKSKHPDLLLNYHSENDRLFHFGVVFLRLLEKQKTLVFLGFLLNYQSDQN